MSGCAASSGSPAASGADASTLTPCPQPSIDRLAHWGPTEVGEGMTAVPPPSTPSLLERSKDGYVARFSFAGSGWGVVAVWLDNRWGAAADLSASEGLTVTYSSTADFFIDMRPAHAWDGGDHFRTALPGTNGEKKTLTVSFAAENWTLPEWSPAIPYEPVLADVQGFTITTFEPNEFVFYGLRVQGHVPACEP